ncbi:MAG TPA: transcriptional repressor [Alphaproteobacteria bacterium]|nr:transcriptional repressor [Alphaproteobacteria bacterium]
MSVHDHTHALDKQAVIELLQAKNIQPTQQRVEIAQLLFSRPQHMCAEEVLAAANRGGAVVSKATVYNTLGLFAQKGLVREVIVDPNRVFYDSNTAPHHHFYNVDTGELTDIGESQVAIGDLPALPPGTEPDGVEVIIRVRKGR